MVSIATLAVAVFLWDWGVYALLGEFVAKLFMVVVITSGILCYHEMKHAIVVPQDTGLDSSSSAPSSEAQNKLADTSPDTAEPMNEENEDADSPISELRENDFHSALCSSNKKVQ